MKKTLAALLVVFAYCPLHSQDFNTMAGDWIRVHAEYVDGEKIPNNHPSRMLVRYYFAQKEVYQVLPGNTYPCAYTRTGSVLKIAPVQTFSIEAYTDKALTLVDTEGPQPIRYFLIPTDSFQVSGGFRYHHDVVGSDSIYTIAPGIEPIYPKGQNEFMNDMIMGFTQKVAFDFTYVVRNDGTIGDVIVKASTNPKLDKRLIQLVRKTSGKWIPATYKGKPIHVRLTGKLTLNSSM